MNKPRLIIAALAASALSLSACSTGNDFAQSTSSSASAAKEGAQADSGDTISIEDNHGTQQVPKNPQAVASTDNRTFEVLAKWGIPLVAAPKPIVPFTVEQYKKNDEVIDLGSHREPDLEALTAAEPDLIVNGQRFKQHYDDIKKLNPDTAIVEFEPREGEPLDAELKRQTTAMGEIFGKQKEAQALVDDFDKALERARKAYNKDQKVMAVNVSGGTIGYIAPSKGRVFGPIFDMVGMTPALEIANASDDHQGDDISVEAIAQANPDWILVLDRDAGTSKRDTAEYVGAKQVISGAEALKNTKAISEDHVYYAPEDTYTNESIITYTEILNQIADQFEAAQK
ncbi:siderophore ABC transporter substrate-binding protein [Corynebacterium tapiri]|uniref:Iron ABC transporter substrate-binding protein n=1 Tax=Corynebacterium tapiri TaxID=1448266 RepID=A0A5C4U3T2_9CORY|nr:ABC transporter substrate-binding protein [Corynebacterium tapiri]TNL98373.1 iron ABC transporter substrate-binding protein [Corynebacterium tapiri]